MSSYHSSFTYLNKNSQQDFKWFIVHFDPDNGETDSYLSQEQVYTESYNGKKRILYGTKWNAVAEIKITVIKQDGTDFSIEECRNAYRWLTGNQSASWLDLYSGGQIKYSFLGTVSDVKPQKLDARTIGLNIYFESISPWAYSPMQTFGCSFGQDLSVNTNGVLYQGEAKENLEFPITDGVFESVNSTFEVTDVGTIYVDNSVNLEVDNLSDDLYTYIFLETTFSSATSREVSIKNKTLDEETLITNVVPGEIVTLSANQFIVSDKPNKIFGDSFNFVWPRLAPGVNKISVSGSGIGSVNFTYRYPIKIGDCAIDIEESIYDYCNV